MARTAIGLFALFSGVALLTNILAGVALPLALATTALISAVVIAVIVLRAGPGDRLGVARTAVVGLGAGFLALVVYDASKAVLSQLDPSPYNPFEALRRFGRLLLGATGSEPDIVLVGSAYHLLNGLTFGVAYAFLFGRDGRTSRRWALLTGLGWGVFLELFQLTLYPGWLDIKFYAEFVQISALSHLVFGATLGLLVRYGLRRSFDPEGRPT